MKKRNNTVRCKVSAREDFKKNKWYYCMVLPGLIALLLFSYGPMFGLAISVYDYNPVAGFKNSEFVGLKWFKQALGDVYYRTAIRNTVIIKIAQTLVTFPIAVLLALFLNEIKNKSKKLFQTATILPYFISWVVIATMFRNLLSPTNGLVNEILVNVFRMEKGISFLSEPHIFPFIIILQDAWKMAGYWALIFLTAISGIDPSLYEVATLDGAGRWRKMLSITLPCIKTTLITVFIILMGYLVIGPFEQVFTQYSPSVYATGDIAETFSFRMAMTNNNYGYATATGLIQSFLASILVISTNICSRRIAGETIY
nr:ABC transporter permease subunit [uncultured Eisenbergiella sp.]